MIRHKDIPSDFKGRKYLQQLIKQGKIRLAGNAKLKIYGRLDCKSGRRMLRENRVFFRDEEEAMELDFRPCAHCLDDRYQWWKLGIARLRHK
ncbi:MAG: metal-binding protein [Bacteroidetes bacterium]|nr:MAG: metal-binding protein [Bacteroidota bacterium]